MAEKSLISIIIVHYHVEKQLLDCIRSIYAQKTQYPFEIVIVDNDEKAHIEKDLQSRLV